MSFWGKLFAPAAAESDDTKAAPTPAAPFDSSQQNAAPAEIKPLAGETAPIASEGEISIESPSSEAVADGQEPVDPLVAALESQHGDMYGALKSLSRRIDLNEKAQVSLVYFAFGTRVGDKGFELLSKVESIEALDITDSAITDAGVKHLAAMPRLRELVADITQLGDNGVQALEQSQSLRRLSVAATKITDVGLVHIGKLVGLEALNLSGTAITHRGLAHLAELTQLQSLDLSENNIRDGGAQHLSKMAGLKTISLNDTRIGNESARHLLGFEKMIYLNIKRTFITEEWIAKMIESMPYAKINR